MSEHILLQKARSEHQAGRHESAVGLLGIFIAQQPSHVGAKHQLGKCRLAMGQAVAASELFQAVTKAEAQNATAFLDLGDARRQVNDFSGAIEACSRGLELDPLAAQGYISRGVCRWALDLREGALADLRRAETLQPLPKVQGLLATFLIGSDKVEEALAQLTKAIAGEPGNAVWHKYMANCQQRLGDVTSAFHTYHKAVLLDERYAEAYSDFSGLLSNAGSFELGKTVARLAIDLDPTLAEAHYNLGMILQLENKEAEALACYRSALAHRPDYPIARVQLCVLRQRHCDWAGLDRDWAIVRDQSYRRGVPISPFALLGVFDDPDEHLVCARTFAAVKGPAWTPLLATYAPRDECDRDRRLRIGYLSADFHTHATTALITEHFERHDRSRFEIFAYSMGPDDKSAMRARVRASVEHFIEVKGLKHEEAARRIQADAIDILVDLKGYTLHSKVEILAHRPAPIQVSFLGYPGTMGAPFIDYVIADPVVLPMDQQVFYDEKIVHLPDCYQPNDRLRPLPTDAVDRARYGLPPNAFVFCCFNYTYKIAPDVFATWMSILHAVPHAIVWLLSSSDEVAANLRAEAARAGIDPQRLVFAPRLPLHEHLTRVAAGDLFLDTLPYNAHTTASDALWVGVPVLTCAGRAFAGRVAASLLNAVGLPEMITTSARDYEAEAIRLASDPAALARLKGKLVAGRSKAALFDTDAYTRHFEAALDEMAALRDLGEAPRPLTIKRIAE